MAPAEKMMGNFMLSFHARARNLRVNLSFLTCRDLPGIRAGVISIDRGPSSVIPKRTYITSPSAIKAQLLKRDVGFE
jgi:hypothetical protein